MNCFPLGEIEQERYDISMKYGLIELVNGVYRLTDKNKRHYDQISYIKYLRGNLEKPIRIESKTAPDPIKKEPEVVNDPLEFKNPECQKIVSEILSL